MARIPRGDKKAFKEVLRRYQTGVYRFALSMIQDTHDAEDISQEVFLRMYRAAENYRSYASLRTYLYRIARNLCIDHIQKKRPEIMSEPPELFHQQTPYYHLSASELRDEIQDVIATLPENQRAALHLRHIHDMSYKEISQTLNVTVQAVESLLTRARRTFRKRYKSMNKY